MSDELPDGYRHFGYAALPLCQRYVEYYEGDHCVHCKWFEMHEPATVFSSDAENHTKETASADVEGSCRRYPPRIYMKYFENGEHWSGWPDVMGRDRCGEFKEQRRTGEEICASHLIPDR